MKIIIVTFFVLILGLLDVLNPVRSVFQSITAPIQFGLRSSAVELKELSQLFYNINNIRKENLDLLGENQELRGTVVDLKNAKEENKILRQQLDLKNEDVFERDLLLSSVMGNSKDNTGTSIMLDKGSKHGVKVGDNVILGNFLVGIVTETTQQRSIVNLVTSPEVSMTVKNAENNSQAEGIATGNLGTGIVVTRLLPGELVEIGHVFSTSGKDGKFMSDLAVGNVKEVSYESSEPLRTAYLEPMANLNSIERVFVILTP